MHDTYSPVIRRGFFFLEPMPAPRIAAQATEPSIKSAYEKVAEHWLLLARLESLVAADSEDA